MFADIQRWVRSCILCSQKKQDHHHHKDLLLPIPILGPWEPVSAYCMGPLPVITLDNRYVVVQNNSQNFLKLRHCHQLKQILLLKFSDIMQYSVTDPQDVFWVIEEAISGQNWWKKFLILSIFMKYLPPATTYNVMGLSNQPMVHQHKLQQCQLKPKRLQYLFKIWSLCS